jgi:hypothetical protein
VADQRFSKSGYPLLITTKQVGTFVGLWRNKGLPAERSAALTHARMIIYAGTRGGLGELCVTGPTSDSVIGPSTEFVILHDITAIFSVEPEAWARLVEF